MVHRQVVAKVEQFASAVVRFGDVVCVLDRYQEGIAGVVYVQPVDRGHELVLERQYYHVCAEGVAPVVLLAVIGVCPAINLILASGARPKHRGIPDVTVHHVRLQNLQTPALLPEIVVLLAVVRIGPAVDL